MTKSQWDSRSAKEYKVVICIEVCKKIILNKTLWQFSHAWKATSASMKLWQWHKKLNYIIHLSVNVSDKIKVYSFYHFKLGINILWKGSVLPSWAWRSLLLTCYNNYYKATHSLAQQRTCQRRCPVKVPLQLRNAGQAQ